MIHIVNVTTVVQQTKSLESYCILLRINWNRLQTILQQLWNSSKQLWTMNKGCHSVQIFKKCLYSFVEQFKAIALRVNNKGSESIEIVSISDNSDVNTVQMYFKWLRMICLPNIIWISLKSIAHQFRLVVKLFKMVANDQQKLWISAIYWKLFHCELGPF